MSNFLAWKNLTATTAILSENAKVLSTQHISLKIHENCLSQLNFNTRLSWGRRGCSRSCRRTSTGDPRHEAASRSRSSPGSGSPPGSCCTSRWSPSSPSPTLRTCPRRLRLRERQRQQHLVKSKSNKIFMPNLLISSKKHEFQKNTLNDSARTVFTLTN